MLDVNVDELPTPVIVKLNAATTALVNALADVERRLA
jgi:hypothetical protein